MPLGKGWRASTHSLRSLSRIDCNRIYLASCPAFWPPRDEIVAFHHANVLGIQFQLSMATEWSTLPGQLKLRDQESSINVKKPLERSLLRQPDQAHHTDCRGFGSQRSRECLPMWQTVIVYR